MYYKIINDQMVFSDCKTIRMEDGTWISNPTEEQIAEAGWTWYTPPIIPRQTPDTESIAEAVKKMLASSVENLTDEEALEVAAAFPTWAEKIGTEVRTGERLWYDDRLWKVLQPHTPQEDWKPDTAVSLYAEVSIEEIPEWVQPISAETAYHLGDKVSHNDKIWESTVDNNVWEPGAPGTENLWREV